MNGDIAFMTESCAAIADGLAKAVEVYSSVNGSITNITVTSRIKLEDVLFHLKV